MDNHQMATASNNPVAWQRLLKRIRFLVSSLEVMRRVRDLWCTWGNLVEHPLVGSICVLCNPHCSKYLTIKNDDKPVMKIKFL